MLPNSFFKSSPDMEPPDSGDITCWLDRNLVPVQNETLPSPKGDRNLIGENGGRHGVAHSQRRQSRNRGIVKNWSCINPIGRGG